MFLLSKCPPTELVLSAVLVQQFGNVSRNIPDTHHYLFDVSGLRYLKTFLFARY